MLCLRGGGARGGDPPCSAPAWPEQFLGEPCGRDTLNAVGFSAAVLVRRDPEAIVGVFTADHVIEPVDQFQTILSAGYALVEQHPEALVTFGITPTGPATAYGYLELGKPFDRSARRVRQFREKPDLETAQQYFAAGPTKFLWNSGMLSGGRTLCWSACAATRRRTTRD